jgi:K(+)-stimulated pyrophosphate-energized sodium pump
MGKNLHLKYLPIDAERGSIYSEDGNMLSTSVPIFDIYVDFGADALREKDGKRFKDNVDSLSLCLANLFKDKAKPEYEKCVAISTKASIREMMMPGAIALITPLIVGFTFGPEVLGGLLAGVTVSGVLMGIFQSNAGGAWDNAKKSFEKGVMINGEMHYKKSEPHKASVTGDTVGDPFKDTSGPSMNILIKLMSIVSLVIAPTLAQMQQSSVAQNKTEKNSEGYKKEIKIEQVTASLIHANTAQYKINK